MSDSEYSSIDEKNDKKANGMINVCVCDLQKVIPFKTSRRTTLISIGFCRPPTRHSMQSLR